MKNVLWLIVGFAAGFVAAQRVGKTEAGKAFFDDVEEKIQGFSDTFVDGYRSREAELRSMLADFSSQDQSSAPESEDEDLPASKPTGSPA
jgi:demethoxyubiquinone hydroxylase (CLK1/Coq7/Cat5 family)